MCSNTCNYAEMSVQLRTGSDLQTIDTGDCIPNPDPASGHNRERSIKNKPLGPIV